MNAQITRYSPPTVLNPEILRGHNIDMSRRVFHSAFNQDEVPVNKNTVLAFLKEFGDVGYKGIVRVLLNEEQWEEYRLFLIDLESQEQAEFFRQVGTCLRQDSRDRKILYVGLLLSLLGLGIILTLGLVFGVADPRLLVIIVMALLAALLGGWSHYAHRLQRRLHSQISHATDVRIELIEQQQVEKFLKFFEPVPES